MPTGGTDISGILIALIVGAFGFAGSMGLAYMTNKAARDSKAQDYAREDAVALAAENRDLASQERQAEVATQAAAAADLLLAANKRNTIANEKTLAATERSASNTEQIGGKLDVIHGLVNSALTAAIQDTLDQTIMLRAALTAVDKSNPTPEGKEAIALADKKIADLTVTVDDRNAAAAKLDEEAKASGLGPSDASPA
jgi:hypothetical protein